MNNTEIWLERLTSLYKSQMRQTVSAEGIQLVHFEILQYLSISNHYSNTAQALSEYLGQTKGSISQSLKVMEKMNHIKRESCNKDKRVIRLYLTKQGKACLQRLSESMALDSVENDKTIKSIKSLLMIWQSKNKLQGFGQCESCHYNRHLSDNKFQCGLTEEKLSSADIKKICREHEFDMT